MNRPDTITKPALRRIAMISVHGCPMAAPGVRTAGGMNVYLRHIAPLLAAEGICVDVFTRSHTPDGPMIVDLGERARVVHLPAGDPRLNKAEVVPYLQDFADGLLAFTEMEGLGYDVVHSHYWLSGDVGKQVARAWGVPHIVSFHTVAAIKEDAWRGIEEPIERKAAEQEMAMSAHQILAFTSAEADTLHALYDAPQDRVRVVPGGVDLELFAPGDQRAARAKLGIAQDQKIVLFVGRVEPFKGPDVLLHALAQMDTPEARLLFVGGDESDPNYAWLHRAATDAGVIDRVRFQPAVPQADLPDYYRAADICAAPSFHESFGFVVLEAMACGTPVVAAPVGALRTLILSGETGCLVSGHAAEAFACCLEELLSDQAMLRCMGEAARKRALEFPWSRVTQETLATYRAALVGFADRVPATPCAG